MSNRANQHLTAAGDRSRAALHTILDPPPADQRVAYPVVQP
jgi:hypothetical protein